MTSFEIYTINNAPENSRPLLEKALETYKFVPNLLATMAESPALLEGYMTLSSIFSNSSLSATEQQIVLLTASYENECHYCMAAHSVISQMSNVSDAVINAIRDGTAINDSKLEALREFTRITVNSRGWPEEIDINTFMEAGYTRQNIFEVVLGVGLKTLSNYTNHMASTVVDDAFQAAVWKK